ncbi:penicillin-binding protein activator [Chitinilyticum litopenaei]|uniref:penicillin-binding protein activator n=1 Tax=Chitinilyticum litopenaei TaxID=1121276 RepID=UPI00040AD71C|nr:penicillin-binding protein activator [Chitinilyticum litopenaei]
MHANFPFLRTIRIAAAVLYGALALSATAAETASAAASAASKPAIALLLPAKSKSLKAATEQIRAGVLAAERQLGNADIPPVRLYDTTDTESDVLAQLERAQQEGAVAIIGPLSKSAVNYIADNGQLSVPVLALNSFDNTTLQRPQLFSFSLSIEAEASQLAALIHEGGLRRPVLLQGDGALAPRMVQGFIDSWLRLTGEPPIVLDLADPANPPAQLGKIITDANADSVILATSNKQAKLVRPYLGNERLVFGTSQIDSGTQKASIDLAGVRFLDMPWLATPELEDYAVFQRKRLASPDLERLFALGLDAWRIAAALATASGEKEFSGVTGQLRIGDDGVISRELVLRTVPGRVGGTPPAATEPATAPAVP